MAKNKIPKDRPIGEMFSGIKETITFENADWEDEPQSNVRPAGKRIQKTQTPADFRAQFFTEDLQKKAGAILLDIKMAYYKDGIGDISLEVVKDGRNVVIKTAPKTSKKVTKQK